MCAILRSNEPQLFRRNSDEVSSDVPASLLKTGLRFVSDTQPGIRRYRRGKGYLYTMPASTSPADRPTTIHDEATLTRIKALAIPDSWRQVWISPHPEGHLQATGRDSSGRRQSRFHPHWRTFRDESHFEHMLRLGNALPSLRARVETDLDLPGMPRERVLAILIRLMDSTESGSIDVSRAQKSEIEIEETNRRKSHINGITYFQINGKGKKHVIDTADRNLNRIASEYIDMPGFELFQYIDSQGKRARVDCSDINGYLRSSTCGDLTARDFRTWRASVIAFEFLSQGQPPKAKEEADKRITEAVRRVSRRLLHTPAVCHKCLIHPAVIESYLDGTMHHWLDPANRASSDTDRQPDFLKLAIHEQCLYRLLEDWAARLPSSTST